MISERFDINFEMEKYRYHQGNMLHLLALASDHSLMEREKKLYVRIHFNRKNYSNHIRTFLLEQILRSCNMRRLSKSVYSFDF